MCAHVNVYVCACECVHRRVPVYVCVSVYARVYVSMCMRRLREQPLLSSLVTMHLVFIRWGSHIALELID